ncbi:NAD(P)/FAD-dependent oxidoreductase [Acidithiobacillus sp. IBUN Pt1247-S3]|uniref:dihydrolipoyl dehydrogenase family protein n=1 Tax=Acidithiobacillus sp. IBUN Pt1247-S3 TaxID=3166642 RepID=UPI0034E3DEE1
MKEFDIVIIGSGPGGYRASVLATLRGKKVAIIEKGVWGGTCLNRGCVPKKDWHETAKWIENSRHFAGRGILGETLRGNMAQAWQHQHKVVETVRESYVDYLKRLGVQMYSGVGSYRSAREIMIQTPAGEETIHTEYSVIATGSTPRLPQGANLQSGKILHSDMLFDDGVPQGDRVIIVGGGVIGTEFAYIFTQLGKEVRWLVNSAPLHHLRYSPQAKDALMDALTELQIEPRRKFAVANSGVDGEQAWVANADGERESADWVLFATGRAAHTEALGLANTAVVTDDQGFVQTDEHLETAESGIYAIGDVVGPYMNANQALADATLVIDNILADNRRERAPLWVPELVYSAVELARIGMDENEAEDEGFEPAVGFAAFETSPRALGQDDTRGFARILADMDSGEFLGGEIVGRDAGELIHLLSQGSDREEILRRIANSPVNHPARAEELLNATETLAARWGLGEFIFAD